MRFTSQNFTFPAIVAPTGQAGTIDPEADLLAVSGLSLWVQGDSSHVTQSGGEITQFNDKAGGAGTFVPLSSDTRAALDGTTINGRASATFSESGTADVYQLTNQTIDTDTLFSVAGVIKPDATNANGTILGRFTSASERFLIQTRTDGGAIGVLFGTSVALEADIDAGVWNTFVFSRSATELKLSVNGGDVATRTIIGTSGSAGLFLGNFNSGSTQTYDGGLRDLLIFESVDLHGVSLDLAKWSAYVSNQYALA